MRQNDIKKSTLPQENNRFERNTQSGIHAGFKYNCLCAWPLFCVGQDAGDVRYQQAAVKVIRGALEQQQPNGWFLTICLSEPKIPLSYTIAQRLRGILEVACLAGREDFIAAARTGTDPLLQRISSN